mmetsp:Transcript_100544/g.255853  ORF Transcript_100544/g.255853 Transcript_100544/m.255853 type:complete len:239 (+) Transcript_100544:241-957(+)
MAALPARFRLGLGRRDGHGAVLGLQDLRRARLPPRRRHHDGRIFNRRAGRPSRGRSWNRDLGQLALLLELPDDGCLRAHAAGAHEGPAGAGNNLPRARVRRCNTADVHLLAGRQLLPEFLALLLSRLPGRLLEAPLGHHLRAGLLGSRHLGGQLLVPHVRRHARARCHAQLGLHCRATIGGRGHSDGPRCFRLERSAPWCWAAGARPSPSLGSFLRGPRRRFCGRRRQARRQRPRRCW